MPTDVSWLMELSCSPAFSTQSRAIPEAQLSTNPPPLIPMPCLRPSAFLSLILIRQPSPDQHLFALLFFQIKRIRFFSSCRKSSPKLAATASPVSYAKTNSHLVHPAFLGLIRTPGRQTVCRVKAQTRHLTAASQPRAYFQK